MSELAATSNQQLAYNRFGLGIRADALPVALPREALLTALDRPDALLLSDYDLMTGMEVRYVAEEFTRFRQVAMRSTAPDSAGSMMPSMPGMSMQPEATREQANEPTPDNPQSLLRNEIEARTDHALFAEIGFGERLVWFWSNHFCVSVQKSSVLRATAGAYEREAIRPYVLGRFADMLLASVRHPAMQGYLDNVASTGPNSTAGRRNNRGLNENHAREILELHTLGVDGGYDQNDVTSLARILTGWGIAGPNDRMVNPTGFRFNPNRHEPGAQTVLGKTYDQKGVQQGEQVLLDLARHPSTARHIASKFAAHFIADEPPAALLRKLEETFMASDGDLRLLAKALIEAPDSWDQRPLKFRSPIEWLTAAHRALGAPLRIAEFNGYLSALGQSIWQPPGPNGHPDNKGAWLDAEGLATRLDIAARLATRASVNDEPLALASKLLGEISADASQTIARAESRQQAFALLLMTPEFQWR
jgi:uncharacterized protein (DUF1800 family)